MKMAKFKFASAAMAAAVALAMAGAAQAATYDLGMIGIEGYTLDGVELPASGKFTDTFTFTLDKGLSTAQVGVTSIFYSWISPAVPGISLSLDGGPVVSMASGLDATGDNVAYGYTFTGLQFNHQYSLVVSGVDSSNLGTSYSFEIAAVPEPETYAMFMAGLGLMGMIAKRRKGA